MRFGTQLLLLQLACVIAVVAVCTAVFAWLGVQQLRAEAESTALAIARTVASDPDVRAEVARISSDPGTPSNDQLRGAPLAMIAAAAEARSDALFVVITDDHGIRLAHPDPERLGEQVSTSFEDALAGRETVAWEAGTLGESARAKVPVFSEAGVPVGEVSVGFAPTRVFADLPPLLLGVGLAAVAALAIGAIVSVLIQRRLERATLGLQPEELSALVQDQAAVLDGVGDGVLAYRPDGIVTVANTTAARLLGTTALVGRDIRSIDVPERVREVMSAPLGVGEAADGAEPLLIGDCTVFIDTHRVAHGGRDLGIVAVIRDRTDVVELSGRLESVASMTNALRVQRHEFANRLHVAAGLIDADRVPDARAYLDEVLDTSPGNTSGATQRLTEPFLRSIVDAKAMGAAERGVQLRLGEATLVLGTVAAPDDVATVLANLVDNAIRAAVEGDAPRWVEVELLDDDDTLAITVADSGHGVASQPGLFDRPRSGSAGDEHRVDPDAVHGHGVGLPLIREIAERRGGAVWLAPPGGPDTAGAVFCARLPGAMVEPVSARQASEYEPTEEEG